MTVLQSGLELLNKGEVGLFIYTNGLNLKINSDGSGESGWWVFSPDRHFDRVFIFWQSEGDLPSAIWSGRCLTLEGPDEGRYLLRLTGIRCEGHTWLSWTSFASAGQNPIRFLSRP